MSKDFSERLRKLFSHYCIINKIENILSKINYGLRNPKTNLPWRIDHNSTSIIDYDYYWELATPDQTIKSGVGNCYDTVALSLAFLFKTGITHYAYFMTISGSRFDGIHITEVPTHTFLIYQDPNDNKWRWLEGSWGFYKKNNYSRETKEELIELIASIMFGVENKPIEVYKLVGYPDYGCNMVEFERYCRNCKLIYRTKTPI